MIADRVLLGERGKHGQSPRMKTFHYVRAMQRVSAVSGIVLNKALHLGLPRLRTLWIARYLDINIRKLMCRIGIEVKVAAAHLEEIQRIIEEFLCLSSRNKRTVVA